MLCQSCSTSNSTDAKFCRKCGNPIDSVTAQRQGSVDAYFAKQTRGCHICNSLADTKSVNFYQLIGMVIILRYSSIKGRLCKKCINREFKTKTITTFLFGWWGAISFFLTPLVIVYNIIRYIPSMGMSELEN